MLSIATSIRPSHLQFDMDATSSNRKAHGIHSNDSDTVGRASKTLALFDDDDILWRKVVKTSCSGVVPCCT